MREVTLNLRKDWPEKQVSRFESRYGMPLARFEQAVLSKADSFAVHEAYNDWIYWQNVVGEWLKMLNALKPAGVRSLDDVLSLLERE